ncbi:DUF4386 family protein [Tahibacter harae]|uniref:DUF4386 domain-containing protein n=1 Tax=Tahibacter harae TaxID=2963937 RepID=A0ABT1QQK1_9GAMM|nr:DUF4386 family protein [Tahibacter harae]MCQ4164557.1 DUF4386 domain-containing protein [Tahibacter harae]
MENPGNLGRWLGAGLLATFVMGIYSNFALQPQLFGGEGLLVNAAAHPRQIGLITVLGMATSLISVWLAALLLRSLGRARPLLATAYFALVVAGLAVSAVEYATLIAFRTLGEHYQTAGPEPASLYLALKKLLGGLRNGIHFLDVSLGGLSMLLFFCLLRLERLLPAALGWAGIVATGTQILAVAPALFGGSVIYPLLAPLALVYLAAILWLVWRGFPAGALRDGAALGAATR